MLTRQEPAGYAAACAAIRNADFTANGDQDGSTPPELVELLARSIPGARFEIIPGAGHIPCVEQPEQLADLIRRFMNDDMRRAPA